MHATPERRGKIHLQTKAFLEHIKDIEAQIIKPKFDALWRLLETPTYKSAQLSRFFITQSKVADLKAKV